MSIRVDTASWIPGAIVVGNRGLGVLADAIPSDGDNGASFLYNDISLPADSGKEICGRITTWPSSGTLYAYEDGSFEFTGAPDGQYSFDYTLFVDGMSSGTGTVSLQVGDSTVDFAVTTDASVFSGSAGSGGAISIDAVADASVFFGASGSGGAASITALTDASVFFGSAKSGAMASIAAIIEDATFVGASLSLPQSSALIAAVTGAAAFSGTAQVSPVGAISAQTDEAVFIGSALVSPRASFAALTDSALFIGSSSVVMLGDVIWPSESDVRLGVSYGPTGSEYIGTMAEGTGTYPTAESIAAAVLAALQGTTIPVNIKQVNDVTVQGAGTKLNPWQPV